MSMPSCIRPQRQPKPLTTGPLTGQTRPLADGVVSPLTASEVALGTDWAALIRAASCALTA